MHRLPGQPSIVLRGSNADLQHSGRTVTQIRRRDVTGCVNAVKVTNEFCVAGLNSENPIAERTFWDLFTQRAGSPDKASLTVETLPGRSSGNAKEVNFGSKNSRL